MKNQEKFFVSDIFLLFIAPLPQSSPSEGEEENHDIFGDI